MSSNAVSTGGIAENPTALRIVLKKIEGLDLPNVHSTPPSTFVVVRVDDKTKHKTKIVKKNTNPEWIENDSIKMLISPSSDIRVQVYRRGRFFTRFLFSKQHYFLGGISLPFGDLAMAQLRQGSEYLLASATASGGSIRIVSSVESTISTIAELGLASQDEDLDRIDRALRRRDGDSAPFQSTSQVVDQVEGVASDAQAVVAAAQQVESATGIQVLGNALQYLDGLVKIVDNVADAHPMLKLGWTLLSSVYKTLQAQSMEDEVMHALAIDLRDMLGYARRCTKAQIDGTTDILVEVGRVVSDAATIIDKRMKHGFTGRAATLAFQGSHKQIKDCQNRLAKLQGKLGLNLQVKTHELQDKTHRITVLEGE
ncbi:hypothetical protein BV25DRAFT_1903313 [Artomyces pyxidatus]|uniref:Uncharacterized protein n=1 Tax=Artomyces pyxidatus TaxID=48021 RepID=A0ACB8SIQ9_9AGAM|nr:hypothetical protein BV25DRAFT_1903313 [Artomyces pyxidatus]